LTSNPLGCNLLSQFHYISPVSTEFQYPLWFVSFLLQALTNTCIKMVCVRSTKAQVVQPSVMLCVCRYHPVCCSTTWICMGGYTPNVIIYSRFHQNPFRAFKDNGGSKISFLRYFDYWLLQQTGFG